MERLLARYLRKYIQKIVSPHQFKMQVKKDITKCAVLSNIPTKYVGTAKICTNM
jgi:hypothetical protein